MGFNPVMQQIQPVNMVISHIAVSKQLQIISPVFASIRLIPIISR
jgi:hypothetical protein